MNRIQKLLLLLSDDGISSPLALPNLAAWFQFNTGITDAGGGLASQWADQSGNGRHLKQATSTNQPTINVDGSILFDGLDNFMKCDAFTLNQPWTAYLLIKPITWTSNRYFFDGNTANRIVLRQISGTPLISITDHTTSTSTTALPLGAYAVVSTVLANGGTSSVQVNNNTEQTATLLTTAQAGFTLGSHGGGTGSFSNIEVKEVVIYSEAHDAATKAKVKQYLGRVGGISL